MKTTVTIQHAWTWPPWLKATWIAMDQDGLWCACETEPVQDHALWMTKGNSLPLRVGLLDFHPPPCSDWRQSKRKNPNAEQI
jgi:hypothetical protein